MAEQQIGVIIDEGPGDWQIIQQDAGGFGSIKASGSWVGEEKAEEGTVELRIVDAATAAPVTRSLDWSATDTRKDGTWSTTLSQIPAGGLYRLETRFNARPTCSGEWSIRGDMRHFLGVGDLWIIAGQSNSAGYGRGPTYDPPQFGVHLFSNSGRWMLADHPLNESTATKHPVNREHANPGHSPYLHFGRLLQRELNFPIGLVQSALGGSALAAWNPTESNDAKLFHNMVQCARDASPAGGRLVKGVMWYQGESDTTAEAAATYERRFIAAVGAWREALGEAALPVITVQLNRVYQPNAVGGELGWSLVREAQRQVARKVPGVLVVPSLDLTLSDLIHTSPSGNLVLAERMARAALGGVYEKPQAYLAPDLQSAKRSPDGNEVILSFANLTSLIDNVDITAVPFRVEDEAGEAPIEKVVYPRDQTIRLSLRRSLRGRAMVHGAYGSNPPTVPVDMERLMPMLGFHGVAVE